MLYLADIQINLFVSEFLILDGLCSFLVASVKSLHLR
uniref:Uncharacterized protein n=1 Tax=Rhizophora mucronata TaxID=61149 RepID=A0A2P2JDX0_RHIMU